MSSEYRHFPDFASLSAAGAGVAATVSGWLDGLLGNNSNSSFDGTQVAHANKSSLEDILGEHKKRRTLVSRFATFDICNEYKDKETLFAFTLKDALEAGLVEKEEISNIIGILAGDEEFYTLFPKILNPLIEFLHGLQPNVKYRSIDGRDFECEPLDPRYVLSCRARMLRSLRGYPFAWRCSEKERREIEEVVEKVLANIPGYSASTYVKLSALDEKSRDLLLKKHYMFNPYVNKTDHTWTSGRGIWYGNQDNTVVLVNEQEHLKFISQQTGSDVKSAFNRLRHVVDSTNRLLRENAHDFLFHENYGHLTSSPREIGTGFRVSMNVRLPRLSQEPRLACVLHMLSLEKRQSGIITQTGRGVMELSNSTRTGHTEVDFIKHVVSGIHHLIAMEKLLEDGHVIDPVLCEIIRQNISITYCMTARFQRPSK